MEHTPVENGEEGDPERVESDSGAILRDIEREHSCEKLLYDPKKFELVNGDLQHVSLKDIGRLLAEVEQMRSDYAKLSNMVRASTNPTTN